MTSRQRHQSSTEQSGFAVPWARSVAAGVGFLAAGVVFGAGAALGDLAVRRLLCYRTESLMYWLVARGRIPALVGSAT